MNKNKISDKEKEERFIDELVSEVKRGGDTDALAFFPLENRIARSEAPR